ncbi:MAG: adenylate/guanylate cyclase domain-containing protein [Cyanobacteria bacterium J06638_22]
MAVLQKRQIPIGIKIFGIATSMLGLLLIVVYVSSNRLRRVSEEIESLVDYTIPITNAVAKVDVHALEQEVLFERILKHYEIEPVDRDRIVAEITEFEQRNQEVQAELLAAEGMLDEASTFIADSTQRQDLVHLLAQLEAVEDAHQDFHDHAVDVLGLLEAGQFAEAHRLEEDLAVEEEAFNRSIEDILLELGAFTVAAAQSAQQHQQIVQQLSVAIAMIATVLGGACAWVVTFGLVRPVQQLSQSMQAVQQGDFNTLITPSSRDEVATLTTAFNHMVKELKSKATLEETFGKYVDPRVVKQLLTPAEDTATTGDRQVMTVFFADVEGFSEHARTLSPDDLVTVTNDYLTLMSRPVSNQFGVIDKFIDTLVMGFWGAPFADADEHANFACETALEQQAQLPKIQQLLQSQASSSQSASTLHLRVGIATGSLVVGNMGSTTAKSYTVMGDTVNIASRLKGVTKQYGVAIALTEDTQAMLSDRYATRELDWIQVIGKEEPVRVYELLGHELTLDEIARHQQREFAKGLAAYRNQQWDEAHAHFSACITSDRPDPPAQLYLQRIETFRNHPPTSNWDGVWQMTQK